MPTSSRIASSPTLRKPSRLKRRVAASTSRWRVSLGIKHLDVPPRRGSYAPARVYPKSTESVPPIHWPVAHRAARIRIDRMNNALHERRPSMQRIAFFLYGLSAHALFFVVYAWLIGFVTNLVLP